MKRVIVTALLTVVLVLGLATLALAAESDAVKIQGLKVFAACAIAAGFGIGMAAVGCGLSQGIAIKGALEGTARNPDAAGKIQVMMIIGLALIESLCIYALVISIILLFVFPGNETLQNMLAVAKAG